MNIQSQIRNQYLNNLEQLLENMLKNHHIKKDDLKHGDIQHVISQPLNKEFYILFDKFCYELIHKWNKNKLTLKLIPKPKGYLK